MNTDAVVRCDGCRQIQELPGQRLLHFRPDAMGEVFGLCRACVKGVRAGGRAERAIAKVEAVADRPPRTDLIALALRGIMDEYYEDSDWPVPRCSACCDHGSRCTRDTDHGGGHDASHGCIFYDFPGKPDTQNGSAPATNPAQEVAP